MRPRRFDVVVFRYPRMPLEKGTPKNYIKRLLGLPGELLAIFFGRLYRCPAPAEGEPPYFDDSDVALIDRWRLPYTYSTPEYGGELPEEFRVRTDARVEECKSWFAQSLKAEGRDFEVVLNPQAGHSLAKRRLPKFEIVHQPLDTMLAMRRSVYDNDHPAEDLERALPPRWAGEKDSLWAAVANRGFHTTGGKADRDDWLRYRHILRPRDWPWKGKLVWDKWREIREQHKARLSSLNLPDAEFRARWQQLAKEIQPQAEQEARAYAEAQYPKLVAEVETRLSRKKGELRPQLITDFLSYNTVGANGREDHPHFPFHYSPGNWVGDLMLECQLKVEKSGGEFVMELSKGIDRFQARFDLQSGDCTLVRIGEDGKAAVLDKKPTRMKGPGEYDLRFANIDERLTVWVDRDLPFEDGKTYDAPAKRGPTQNDLQPASVASKGAAVGVHHLKLWRDTYYTVKGTGPDVPINDPFDPEKWAPVQGTAPFKVLYIQPGHYLCLGDNSPQSSDSREWGLVPERLMLGRALMVYFPFDRAGRIK